MPRDSQRKAAEQQQTFLLSFYAETKRLARNPAECSSCPESQLPSAPHCCHQRMGWLTLSIHFLSLPSDPSLSVHSGQQEDTPPCSGTSARGRGGTPRPGAPKHLTAVHKPRIPVAPPARPCCTPCLHPAHLAVFSVSWVANGPVLKQLVRRDARCLPAIARLPTLIPHNNKKPVLRGKQHSCKLSPWPLVRRR